jgi:uncharacterized protein (TIGR01777 family)
MNVLVTGGTGFIGTALCARLRSLGHRVIVLTRDARRAGKRLQGKAEAIESLAALDPASAPDVIVNLAGENLARHRWNEYWKSEFVYSRVDVTQQLLKYIAVAQKKPKVLVSGSAVGFYGARGDEELTEFSPPGSEYQSELCRLWEQNAMQAEAYGVRVCLLRTGIVLDRGGGALKSMLLPFRLGLGGHLGDGRQWMSWIHLEDEIGIILHLINHADMSGPFNATAPNPETNRGFSKKLGAALHRPALIPMPPAAVKLLVGEMSQLLLTGQKVLPRRILDAGYQFRYRSLELAFGAIFS